MTSSESKPSGKQDGPAERVLVIGLDGATWNLLDKLIGEGRLPRIGELASSGAKGVLRSTIPPVTASAWSSLYTGRSPGRHGVYDFRRRMGSDSTHRPWVTQGAIAGPKIWDIASAQDKSSGLLNLPLTFPPVQVNGYMIGGMPVPPARDDIGLPGGLVDEIIAETGEYISDVDLLRGESPDVNDPEKCFEFVEQVKRAAESRGRAMQYLMGKHPTDLTACILVTPDRLSHLFWKLLVPRPNDPPMQSWEKELREKIFGVFEVMDGIVGEMSDRMNPDDLVVMVSDHGFGHLDEILKLNRLLRDLGYLEFKPEVEGGIRRKVGRILPESVKKPLRKMLGMETGGKDRPPDGKKQFDPYALINWPETKAYSGGSVEQGVFINVAGREPMGTVQMGGEYHQIRERLIADLRNVLHPSDGKPLFDWVEPRENVYSGEYLDYAPDIVFSLRGYSMVVGEDAEPPLVGPWSQPRAGFHRREGIIVMKGPMIRTGIEIKESRIEDVAPSILACWGLASDEGMDGEIITDAIDPSFLESHPPSKDKFEDSGGEIEPCGEDAEDMEDLLKGLGYLN